MEPWIWVGIIGGVLAIFGSIGTFMVFITKTISKMGSNKEQEGFAAGTHVGDHKKLSTNVDAAHEKIRRHDERIAKVESSSDVLERSHEMLMQNQKDINGKLDTITEILIKWNGKPGA